MVTIKTCLFYRMTIDYDGTHMDKSPTNWCRISSIHSVTEMQLALVEQ